MPLDIIIGAQWGDEGKGHITDMLAAHSKIVARYSGGDNAGHTVTIGEEVFKLHLIPSGIIHDDAVCLIGSGVVVNPAVLIREMEGLEAKGIKVTPNKLKISTSAHLITPAHVALDKAREAQRGEGAIGTTQRGIGPAYTDKTSREGLRAGLLGKPEQLGDAIQTHIASKNKILQEIYGVSALNADEIAAEYAQYAQRLAPYLTDAISLLDDALNANQSVLAEGAQGTFLDIDHGTYPFVTSSSPTAGGALTGLGVGPKRVGRIIGITKAFTSRVGSGPFVTEAQGETAVRLRGTGDKPWDEYGTTTGRPRRVGWLDLVMMKHAHRINSFTEIVLTKLDILSGLKEIPVCVAYELNGERIDAFPSQQEIVAQCQPIYEVLEGWEEDIMSIKKRADLPTAAQKYVTFVEEQLGVPVSLISVGPGREQIITD